MKFAASSYWWGQRQRPPVDRLNWRGGCSLSLQRHAYGNGVQAKIKANNSLCLKNMSELHKEKGHDQFCTCSNRDIWKDDHLWLLKGAVEWSIINTNTNGNHFMKLCGEAIWRSRPGFCQGDFGLHIRVGARGDGRGLAALALQFLLRPPGGARRALRAGVGGGAEHLFKAASALVRPAYFRLKGAEKQTCS